MKIVIDICNNWHKITDNQYKEIRQQINGVLWEIEHKEPILNEWLLRDSDSRKLGTITIIK